MGYANAVNIRFSLHDIQICGSNVDGARSQTVFLQDSMYSSYSSARNFLESVLSWVDGCLEQNVIDGQNCRNFSQALESLRWDTEKELERRKVYCDQLYKAKNDAYNHYDAVKSKQNPDNPNSEKAVERAWDAYRKAEDAFNDAYKEQQDCERRLDAIIQAQYDLCGIQNKVHDDEMRLTDMQEEYRRMISELDGAYQKFETKVRKAVAKLDYVLEDVKKAQKCANTVVQHIGDLNGVAVSASGIVAFNSISAVQRASERMDVHNEEFLRAEKEMKRTVERFSEDLRDNVMAKAEEMMQDVARAMAKQLKEKERKALVMKDLAKALQSYYDVYQ